MVSERLGRSLDGPRRPEGHLRRHVRHVSAEGVHRDLRISREAGPREGPLPGIPPLRPHDLHRLREVRGSLPVDCIYIEKEKSPVGKGFRIDGFTIDYTKCMFCALCVEPCPVDCIFMGSNHDLSCYSRDGCIVDYAKLPLQVAWGQTTLNPTAVAESKVLYEPVWVKGEPSPFEYASEES